MSTAAQIDANRENAQLSTGPRTEEGRAVSAQNARTHGLTGRFCLLPGENPAEFDALLSALIQEHSAATITETFLVTEMAQAQWKLQRIANMEAEIWFKIDLKPTGAMERAFKQRLTGDDTDTRSFAVRFAEDCANDQLIGKLMRYEETARRAWHKALTQLQKLRMENAKLETLQASRVAKEADAAANRLLAQALTPPIPKLPVAKKPEYKTNPMPVHLQRELDAHKRRDPLFDPRNDRSQMSKDLQKYFDKHAA